MVGKEIHVLHVIPYFRPAFGFGGPATVANLMTTRLAQSGCEVSVWTTNVFEPSGSRVGILLDEPGTIDVFRYRYVLRSLFRATNVLLTPGMVLDALIKPATFGLVHLHDFRSVQSICAFVYAKRTRTPLVLQPHGTLKIVLGKERLKRLYDTIIGNRIIRLASRVVVVSAAEAVEARMAGVPEGKIVTIPNGVDSPEAHALATKGSFRTAHHINPDTFLVLFLGRIRASKGVFTLLDAFAIFREQHPNSVLAICGPDDGAEDEVREIAVRLGLPVVTPGMVTGSEKAAAFIDSDAFCFPSEVETQSMAILEAASYGLPIVAGMESVPPEFIEDGAGVFVNLEGPSLAAGLSRIAGSAGSGAVLASKAKDVVKRHFSLNKQVTNVLALYREVLGRVEDMRPAESESILSADLARRPER